MVAIGKRVGLCSSEQQRTLPAFSVGRFIPCGSMPAAAQLELSGACLRIRSIDLGQDWPRIHHDLLELTGAG